MQSVSPRLRALVAAALCVVIALAAALAVDSRLDRHWIVRGLTLFLALCCAVLLAGDQSRRLRQIIAAIGLLMFGLVFPVTTTTWAKPPEIDFALAVATDAENAATKQARSAVTVADVKAAAESRGGAVGSLKTERSPQVRGAAAFPLIVRAHATQGRPWACITFNDGLNAKIRPC
jgi:energy-coupling factor transporter transmembrane protein EcfT